MKPFGLAVVAAVIFAGCSELPDPDPSISISDDSTQSPYGVLVTSRSGSDAAPSCENGGVEVDTGVDLNGNAELEADEVTETYSVCLGNAGTANAITLVNIRDIEPGVTCVNGGKQMIYGPDSDLDGIIDSPTVHNFCNIFTLLINTETMADTDANQAICEFGGDVIQTGWDLNNNAVLESEEIVSQDYLCSDGNVWQTSILCEVELRHDDFTEFNGALAFYRIDEFTNGHLDTQLTLILNGVEYSRSSTWSTAEGFHQTNNYKALASLWVNVGGVSGNASTESAQGVWRAQIDRTNDLAIEIAYIDNDLPDSTDGKLVFDLLRAGDTAVTVSTLNDCLWTSIN